MKSLNESNIKYSIIKMFGVEIYQYILDEGFIPSKNNSYCYKEYNDDWIDDCLIKSVDSKSYDINVYIFDNGIGVDFDYTCGGNSFTSFWSFSTYSFEDAYDLMVDNVNNNK
jgi:hypothetical protein